MTDPTRRLRVVPPLPGQPAMDLPGLPPPAQPSPTASRRAHPTVSGAPTSVDGVGPVPRLLPTRQSEVDGPDADGPAVAARVPVAVWAVWDGEDLVGVYAEESTARADAAVLQRDATRAGVRERTVDCLPLQVFTEAQYTHRDPRWTPPWRRR